MCKNSQSVYSKFYILYYIFFTNFYSKKVLFTKNLYLIEFYWKDLYLPNFYQNLHSPNFCGGNFSL